MMKRDSFFIYLMVFFVFFFQAMANEGQENSPKRKLRFFCLDFHCTATADIKNIFEELGHEVVAWSVASQGSCPALWERTIIAPHILDFQPWFVDEKVYERFYENYKDALSEFDAYIVTHNSCFALIYEKLNKPVIIVNAVRYEVPFTNEPHLWSHLNDVLTRGVKSGKFFIVANNKADGKYLTHYTGLDSEVIPSLCLYTKANYTGNKDFFIYHPARYSTLEDHICRNYPNLVTGVSRPYSWQDLYDYKGIIHFPYQISTMSIFEQYSANVPLFFPSKEFLIKLRSQYPEVLNCLSASPHLPRKSSPPPAIPGDLNHHYDPQILKFWLDNADFYDEENMPYIQYFESFEHLEQLLNTVDLKAISQKMAEYNEKRKAQAFKKWEIILEKVAQACEN